MNREAKSKSDKTPTTEEIRAVILKEIMAFPALPAMCREVLPHLNDPDVNIKELSEKCKYDPGMTANILKLRQLAKHLAAGLELIGILGHFPELA